jgi:L-alanine-DL-glutamate epimerase-like enolase superfamily enzyme
VEGLAAVIGVDRLDVHAFTVPTDGPDGMEQDGTATWDSTTMVLVSAHAGGHVGLGYTYGTVATATLIAGTLTGPVLGGDAAAPPRAWARMFDSIRNAGRPGIGAMAIAAVDIALWDLAARLRDLPLFLALPNFHDTVPVYGSGGFTNYPLDRLADQVRGWAEGGIGRVKMKTSRDPAADPRRLDAVRAAIGEATELFVDANGALGRKQASYWAERFAGDWGVRWFEEPVSSDDRAGLRLLRDRGPAGLEIAAGEYGYVLGDFAALLDAGAVDCLQADVTRCGGVTGLLQVAGLAAAQHIDLSAHCAPAVSAHAFCAVPRLRHLEYFHDHVRIEAMAFDGVLAPQQGLLRPDPDRPGLGLQVRWADLERYRVFGESATA